MRRYLIPLLIIAVIVAGIFVAWFATRPPSSSPSSGSTGLSNLLPQVNTVSNGGLQQGAVSGTGANAVPPGQISLGATTGTLPATNFGIISNEPAFQYYVNPQNVAVIVGPDGKITSVSGGQSTPLSSTPVQNLIGAAFSYDGNKILVNFGDLTNPQTSIFDLSKKIWVPLATGASSPVWSPNDYRIAYLRNNPDGTVTIMTLDTSKITSKAVPVITLHIQDVALAWPAKNILLLSERPSAYTKGSVWTYNLSQKTLLAFSPPAYGVETLWSKTTSSLILSFSGKEGGRGGALSLSSITTTTIQGLTFNTLPSKCVFNSEVASSVTQGTSTSVTPPYLALYCAVPKDAQAIAYSPLPDAYEQMTLFTNDNFIRVHTDTGSLDNIFSPQQTIDATALRVANGFLFFINRYDQKVYALSLNALPGAN